MKSFAFAVAGFLMFLSVFTPRANADVPRRMSFDSDWSFNLGDAAGAERPDFNDSHWRKLDLPHDWMIEGRFDSNSPGGAGNGYLDGGVGWYRKNFILGNESKGKRIAVDFDGIYMNSRVWINGHDLGKHPYGYTSFEYDLSPFLKFGDEPNLIAVRADVTQPCSRFYSGAGIYRNVWLVTVNPVHIDHWGTYVTAVVKGATAQIDVRQTVVSSEQTSGISVESTIVDPFGNAVASITQSGLDVAPDKTLSTRPRLTIPDPKLWSVETPAQYTLLTKVMAGDTVLDSVETKFGIRTIAFTIDDGFHLNGKRVQIKGVCDHHDLGCLGAAVNRRAMQRQLEILKSFGCNAIRTSHYPPAPELLDLCDEMGFLVMDEAFDEWKQNKTKFGYGLYFDQWSESDIASMVDRDRNHPSIVLWSIGNEIPEKGDVHSGPMSKRLVGIVKREDPTRPVSAAIDQPRSVLHSGFSEPLDVFGVNYNISFFDNPFVHGNKPMFASESASAWSSRGEYGLHLNAKGNVSIAGTFDNQVTGYELGAPLSGSTAHAALRGLIDSPWMAGEFVWTGFDYIGEPSPYHWPSRSSYFGIVDLDGFPKDRYYLYKSQWSAEPVVHLLPHWNWEQFAGKNIPVWCFSNADTVELFLNGKSIGEKSAADRKELHFEWSVPYAPGELKAVGKIAGKVIATDFVKTAGKPAKILLKADRSNLRAGERDLSFVTVSIVDADGTVCPTAANEVQFDLTGPGIIAGTDNGDATNHESFQGHQHKVFNGLGLVVIQAGKSNGELRLNAAAEGLSPAITLVGVR